MKLVRWKRFSWDLAKLPPPEAELPGRVSVRTAIREDQRAVNEVIVNAFSSDSAWSDVLKLFKPALLAQIEAAFERVPVPVLVLTHGQRVIGASLLNLDPEAESHLLSGPCVLAEYRSRGLGTALLQHSLLLLKGHGVQRAHGITKEATPTGKFVYPKFGGVSADHDFEPELTAAR